MYCPRCGTQNNDDGVRFCRACGEALAVVSSAMTKPKSWHLRLARNVEDYLVSKNQRNAEASIVSAVAGLAFLIAGIANIIEKGEVWGYGAFMIISGLASFALGALEWRRYRRGDPDYPTEPGRKRGDLSIYKRSPYPTQPDSLPANTTPQLTSQIPQRFATPPSVTESTTKRLDAVPQRPKEEL